MINTIKEFIFNGLVTLKSLITFEWINFKNWKEWTSLRMLYFMITMYMVIGMIFGFLEEKYGVRCISLSVVSLK